jgi:photosystem II stability/assembly factor-like uncharacterized protein
MRYFALVFISCLFMLSVHTSVQAQASCPLQRITDASATFADRLTRQAAYEPNLDCYWLLQPTNAQIIRLTFTQFSTEINADVLTVYDGADTNAPIRARLSGQALPQPITGSGGALLLRFRTNGTVQERGWTASYTSSTSRQTISASPSMLTFQPILFGETSTATCIITAPDNASPLIVAASRGFQLALAEQSSRVFSDSLRISPAQLQASNGRISLAVRFVPTGTGNASGTLTALNGARELNIPLSATALPAIFWKPASGPFSANIQSLAIAPNQTIFAGTLTGVYRSSASGAAWLQASSGLNANSSLVIRALTAIDNATFAGTEEGLFRSTDNGRTWRKTSSPFASANISSLSSTNNTVYACANGALWLSRTSGDTWERLQSSVFAGLRMNIIFAEQRTTPQNTVTPRLLVGASDTISKNTVVLLSQDNGKTWQREAGFPVGSSPIRGFAVLRNTALRTSAEGQIQATTLFAATAGSGVFRKRESIPTWEQVQKTQNANELVRDTVSQVVVNRNAVYASTFDGVYRSDDAGQSWRRLIRGLTEQTVQSLVANEAELFAGTTAGVFRSTNGGEAWQPVSTGLTGAVVTAIKEIRGFLLAGTLGSGVYRSADNGVTWQLANSGLSARSVFNLVSRAGIVYGTSFDEYTPGNDIIPGVYRSADNGVTWSKVLEDSVGLRNNRNQFYGLINAERALYAGANGGHVWQSQNGFAWRLLRIPQASTEVAAITEGLGTSIFAATLGNGTFRSDDDGTTWTPMNLPTSNPASQIAYSIFTNNGTVFLGTFGGLFRSQNNGASWELLNFPVRADKPTSMQSVDGVLYVATDGNGVWRTVDNGETWQAVNDGIAGNEAQVYSLFSSNGTDLYAGLRGGAVISTSLQLPSDAPRAILSIPDTLQARIGDTVEVPIILRSLGGNLRENKTVSGFLRFNASMLMPLTEQERQISPVVNGERQVPMRFLLTNSPGQTLTTVRLRAVLGNNAATPIMLTNLQTTPSDAIVVMPESGVFTARGLFTGNGTRLYRSQGTSTIVSLSPNPAPQVASVVYELSEQTEITLSLTNIFGQTVKKFFTENQRAGSYETRISLADVPTGAYFLVCSTPQSRSVHAVSVIR